MKKTPEEKYIEELKEKALLHTVNFEGDMIVGKEQLAKMFKDYATQCQQDNAELLKGFCVYLESITQTKIIDKDKLINNFNYLNKQ
jgi:hypothetical protein